MSNHHTHNSLTCSAVWVGWSFTLPFAFVFKVCRCPVSFCLKGFKNFLPRWRLPINCMFFAMASSEDTRQLLLVLMCLHLAVTLWLYDESTGPGIMMPPKAAGPDQPACTHCSWLLMTSWAPGKDMRIVTSIWVYRHDTRQTELWDQLDLETS